jgi:hypothetical protein
MLSQYTVELWASAIFAYGPFGIEEDDFRLATELLVVHLMQEE